jgi:predicted peptidase
MESAQRAVKKSSGYNYLLFLPQQYEKQGAWPLILFLHGAGERGSDLEQVKVNGLPGMVEEREDFPFIVVSPQCPRGYYWSTALLISLLDEIESNYKVDPARIYLTGISMGGYGAWQLAIDAPGRFTALAPVCGGGNPNEVKKIKNLPIWVFHGGKDRIVPISESETMVNALKSAGGNVLFTVYPDAGHDSWTETYRNPELYEWFMKHRRSGTSLKEVRN